MLSASKLQVSNPGRHRNCSGSGGGFVCSHRRLSLRLPPHRRFASLILQSDDNVNASIEPSVSSNLTSAVGSSSSSALNLSQWTLTQRHIYILNLIACAVHTFIICLLLFYTPEKKLSLVFIIHLSMRKYFPVNFLNII